MKHLIIGFAVLFLMTLGTNRASWAAETTFSDGDFANWSFTLRADPGHSATVALDPSEGVPPPCLRATTVTGGGTACGIHINEDVTWDPAVDGAISSISMCLDFKSISGWGQGQAVLLVVRQDGKFYVGPYSITWSPTEWTSYSLGPYSVDSLMYGDPPWQPTAETPDFSASGGPLSFGFTTWNSRSGTYTQLYDNWQVTITSSTRQVGIDIKPGSYPNSVNLGSNGVVPVAILSSEGFDANTVDPDSVVLAGSGVAVRGKGNKLLAHEEDVNGDGLTDLVCQVEVENLDPDQFQDGYALLTASTYDGQAIQGRDEIVIVPQE